MNTSPRRIRTRTQGHCSYCNETNHNISTCDAYIESIHQGYLDEYTHSPNPTLFLPHGRNISMSHLRLLARKIGFPIFHPRNERVESYFGRMHTHYVHLGNAERQRIRDERNERFLQATQEARVERIRRVLPITIPRMTREHNWNRNIPTREVEGTVAIGTLALQASPAASLYYPQYDNPPALVTRNIEHLRNVNWRDIAPQNLHGIFEEIIVANQIQVQETERRKTTVQLHMEPARFGSKSASDECPVCYESADNMVMTKCDHLFCQTCMLQMIRLNCYDLSCALCRSSIKDVYVHSDESMDMMFREPMVPRTPLLAGNPWFPCEPSFHISIR